VWVIYNPWGKLARRALSVVVCEVLPLRKPNWPPGFDKDLIMCYIFYSREKCKYSLFVITLSSMAQGVPWMGKRVKE